MEKSDIYFGNRDHEKYVEVVTDVTVTTTKDHEEKFVVVTYFHEELLKDSKFSQTVWLDSVVSQSSFCLNHNNSFDGEFIKTVKTEFTDMIDDERFDELTKDWEDQCGVTCIFRNRQTYSLFSDECLIRRKFLLSREDTRIQKDYLVRQGFNPGQDFLYSEGQSLVKVTSFEPHQYDELEYERLEIHHGFLTIWEVLIERKYGTRHLKTAV